MKQHQIEHILNAWQDINLCDFVVFLTDNRKELPEKRKPKEKLAKRKEAREDDIH